MVLRIHIFLAHILQNASWEMALKLIFSLSKSPDQVREFFVSQSWLSSSEARSTTSFACLGKLEHRCKDRIVPLSNIQKKKLKVNIFVGERSVAGGENFVMKENLCGIYQIMPLLLVILPSLIFLLENVSVDQTCFQSIPEYHERKPVQLWRDFPDHSLFSQFLPG